MNYDEIPKIILRDGNEMPMVGLGLYKVLEEDVVQEAIDTAVDCGYRLFDTASAYKNEEQVGDALYANEIPRKDIFVTTKVWNNAQRIGDIEGALSRSLERLRLNEIDLYLIHWPVPGCYLHTWKELIRLQESGMVRSIGVSNFNAVQIEYLYQQTGVLPAVNQIEFHPLWNRKDILDYCRKKEIAVQAYAPLARGAYLDRAPLLAIGKKYGKSAAQVGLRWLFQQGVSIIPKSIHPDRIRSNIDIFDFQLTEEEMTLISGMDEHFRAANIPEDLRGQEY